VGFCGGMQDLWLWHGGSFSCSVWDLLVACRTFGCGMGDLLVVVCGIFVVACKSVVTAYVIF